MKEYLDYDQKYPDLIVRLVQFFKNNSKGEKKIWEFCESYKVPKGEDVIQPIVVGKCTAEPTPLCTSAQRNRPLCAHR